MSIFTEESYPNELGRINLPYAVIIDALLRSQPKQPDIKDKNDYAEYFTLPPFIDIFYNDFIFNGAFPTQDQFKEAILQKVGDATISKLWLSSVKGLEYRCNRNYLSVVREFCCVIMIRDLFPEYNPLYNTRLDIEKKIDCMISHDNQYYGLCFMTDTVNGRGQLNHKKEHQVFDNVIYVDIPINLETAHRIADVALYTSDLLAEGLKKYFILPIR